MKDVHEEKVRIRRKADAEEHEIGRLLAPGLDIGAPLEDLDGHIDIHLGKLRLYELHRLLPLSILKQDHLCLEAASDTASARSAFALAGS